jgi:hypothetical protein
MKRSLLFTAITLISMGLLAQEQKEVVTGASYANDVYYSLENGTVSTVQRDNWDIGFVAQVMSVSVLANNGSGVELYTCPDGTIDDWATLDSAAMDWDSMLASPMYNSLETFDMGAFNMNTIPGDDFDYGWGRYNMTTHQITGDSLFVLKTVSGAYKKVAIVQKNPMANTWEFKYANLDGSDEQVVPLNAADYIDNYFVHYSIDSMKFQDREPAMADWDMLFTKYYDYTIPYSVTGVLINDDHVMAQEVREAGMDQATHNTYKDSAFKSDISIIGYDWKKLNESFAYDLIDTVVFYLKSYSDTDSSYYKLYFTDFSGSMGGGIYTFMQEKMDFGVSTEDTQELDFFNVYPNPAGEQINVVFDRNGQADIEIIDMTGRIVYSRRYNSGGFTNYSVDISSLNPGVFFIRVSAEGESNVRRFIKE